MQDELLVFLDEHLVHLLHIHLGTEGDRRKGLGLASGEDGGAVGAREIIDLAPDRTDLIAYAAVETHSLIENHIAHGLLLLGVIISLDERGLLFELLLRNRGEELLLDGLETGFALFLRLGGLGESVALVVAEVVNRLAELLILEVVRIIALVDIGSELFHELFLDAAVLLDLLVSELDGFEHVVLADLVHLALDHHDVLLGGGDHEFKVGVLHLGE